MRKNTILLTAILAAGSAGGILKAADFEKELWNIESQLAESRLAAVLAAPEAVSAGLSPDSADNKWWSVTVFGAAHRTAAKAALNFIDKNSFPDIKAAAEIIKDGSNDETGHFNPSKNGGDVKALWLGKEPFFKGGVLQNYAQFNFTEAYERLGALCHLTQDQAVPVHAANIKHGISDSFEGYGGNDVKIIAARDSGALEPYAYYQAVQDETRAKLPGWTNPATGAPYWVAAPDAPPPGRDVTFGPWGHYGGRNNSDLYATPPPPSDTSPRNSNSNSPVSAHPEIRDQQLAVAGAVTVSVLESASKRLPPLVRDLSVSTVPFNYAEGPQIGYSINFTVYENRSPKVYYAAALYKDGKLLGIAAHGDVALGKADQDDIMFSTQFISGWSGQAVWSDFKRLPPGAYIMDVRLTDGDGNITPDEVNADGFAFNDTRTEFTIF